MDLYDERRTGGAARKDERHGRTSPPGAFAQLAGASRRLGPRFEGQPNGERYLPKMPTNECEVCGNAYDKSFQVVIGGKSHVFDSFECAIHQLAPSCVHCQCRIVGHGVEKAGKIYCCAHCATRSGVTELRDRG
jgi:hypothetical protein